MRVFVIVVFMRMFVILAFQVQHSQEWKKRDKYAVPIVTVWQIRGKHALVLLLYLLPGSCSQNSGKGNYHTAQV